MQPLEAFLDNYGLAAACAIMLTKAVGVPVPVPGDVILLATAARAAEGKLALWLAFVGLLLALGLGGTLQFMLARGPARALVFRYGKRLGLTEERLQRVAAQLNRTGPLGIALGVLTPGVRTAVIPACGIAGLSLRAFVPPMLLGSAADLGLHFAIGYAGAGLLARIVEPSPVLIVVGLALLGLPAWLLLARRRRASRASAVRAWVQATCPACLLVGAVASLEPERGVHWSRAA